MKFAAVLRDSVAELPDTEDLFKKYKQLKKSLKRITAVPGAAVQDSGSRPDDASDSDVPCNDNLLSEANEATEEEAHSSILLDPEMEAEFLRVITEDVSELNERYIEKEEDNVISFESLVDSSLQARSHDEKAAVYRAFIDFHGELLMILHWSILAYTGLVKILKKHRKRTGATLHAPHLEHLLSQPFCSVQVTSDMVRQTEVYVTRLAKELGVPPPPQPAQLDVLIGAHGSETLTSPHAIAAGTGTGVGAAEGKLDAATLTTIAGKSNSEIVGHKRKAAVEQDPGNFTMTLTAEGERATGAAAGADHAGQTAAQVSPAVDNQATRRVRAALNVWKQLQSNVSTPSTVIASGAGQSLPPPSTMTDSSVA